MAEGGIGRTGSEPATNRIHSSLYSRHSKNYVESVSAEICTIMTRLGYGEVIRRWRVEKYCEHDILVTARLRARGNRVTVQTAGSKAEGLTWPFESDRDCLCVVSGYLCVEAGINLLTIPNDINVFRMDTRVYPGHCKLLLKRQSHTILTLIKNALCEDGYGDLLLSSVLLVDEYSKISKQNQRPGMVHHERAGPSAPYTFDGKFKTDRVWSIRCQCPSILQRWAARSRYWPPPVIVQKVVSLGAYVTPVGYKGSEYKHMEWRICFNTGETELVNNLNDTQAKVYVMLKMILNEIIKPNNKEITSYVLKNIILWQAENTPQTEFHPRSLLHWLHDGLRELRTAIEKKQLRYFMIPERNLMEACGLDDALQRKWIADITEMIEMGPRVILRLEKIRKAIVAHPQPMLWYSKTRMELKMLWLEGLNRDIQWRNENGKLGDQDIISNAILERMYEILLEVKQRILLDGCSINDMNELFKRILM